MECITHAFTIDTAPTPPTLRAALPPADRRCHLPRRPGATVGQGSDAQAVSRRGAPRPRLVHQDERDGGGCGWPQGRTWQHRAPQKRCAASAGQGHGLVARVRWARRASAAGKSGLGSPADAARGRMVQFRAKRLNLKIDALPVYTRIGWQAPAVLQPAVRSMHAASLRDLAPRLWPLPRGLYPIPCSSRAQRVCAACPGGAPPGVDCKGAAAPAAASGHRHAGMSGLRHGPCTCCQIPPSLFVLCIAFHCCVPQSLPPGLSRASCACTLLLNILAGHRIKLLGSFF